MSTNESCPDAAKLADLLGGTLPETERAALWEHLEACAACQAAIEPLVEGDASLEALSRDLKETTDSGDPVLDEALDRLKSQEPPEVADDAEGDDGFELDFLEDSSDPDSLGRLGAYEIREVIGRGGMGIVLRGHDAKLNRVVAIKVLAPQLAASAPARKRFLREARAAAAVNHLHVVGIFAIQEGKLPYLAMEFVDGESLQQKINAAGPLELKEILRIGMQIAAGLAAAHEQGLIHRDVKPSNVLLENGVERVKLTDFGLARAVDDVSITRTGEVAGTPEYMSPEQADAGTVDHRSDLFSLGSVLYAMCTGRSPFRAESTMRAMRRVCEDRPKAIREVNPDVPQWLADLIDKLLEKDPSKRIQTAAEVEKLLGGYLAHVQDPSGTSLPRPIFWRKPKRRSRPWLIVVATVLLLAGSLGLTEATGVTQLAATVIRIATGEGTLVIEVDDPNVEISLDGEELSITGAGIEELRLRPGQYRFRATKDGEPVKQELVRITRGGRELVRVDRELEPLSAGDVDSATDYRSIPRGGITRVRRLAGHTRKVADIIVLRDGRRCLTSSSDGSVRLWEIPTSKLLRTFRFDTYWNALAVAPDQQVAATENPKGTIVLFHVETGEPLKELSGHSDAIAHLEFSADGRRLVSRSRDETVRLWDLGSGKELHKFDVVAWWAHAAAFSPDGGKLLYGDGGFTVLWDIETESEAWRDGGDILHSHVARVVFSADGRRVAASTYGGPIHLRDTATGTLLGTLVGHPKSSHITFTPDGRHLVSANDVDKTLRVWSVETFSEICRIEADRAITYCVAVLPDGRHLISGGGFRHEPPDQWIPEGDYDLHVWRLPESVWPDEPATAEKDAFVVVDTHGGEVDKFNTLAEAVRGSNAGDTIEVRGNGPFITDPVNTFHRSVIRAADGFRPVIQANPKVTLSEDQPLLASSNLLVLEGLDLSTSHDHDVSDSARLLTSRGEIRALNCRLFFRPDKIGGSFCALGNGHLHNCLIVGDGAVVWRVPSEGRFVVENCICVGGQYFSLSDTESGAALQLAGNTLLRPNQIHGLLNPGFGDIPKTALDTPPREPLQIVASRNVLDWSSAAFQFQQTSELGPYFDVAEAERLLPRLIRWTEERNLFCAGRPFLDLFVIGKTIPQTKRGRDLDDWNRFWGLADTKSFQGSIRYQGGDLHTNAVQTPEQLTPEDFRLHPDSAGYQAGPDGKDLGADVDLVGPGEAYERWKKTPDYQQWQEETRKILMSDE